MQIVYDVYDLGKPHSTYSSLGKANAARYRLGARAHVQRRVVRHGESPRWVKPKKRQPVAFIGMGTGAELAGVAARLLFGGRQRLCGQPEPFFTPTAADLAGGT